MDNLINTTEEYKKERDKVITISILIALVIIAAGAFIPLAIRYASQYIGYGIPGLIVCSPFIICILLGLLTLYLHSYNRELGDTVISERESHGSRGGGYQKHTTTLLDVVFTIFVALCVLIIIALILIYLVTTIITFGPIGPIIAPFILIMIAFSWIANLFKGRRPTGVVPA